MIQTPDPYSWGYVSRRARCRHLIRGRRTVAECGVAPVWSSPKWWLGTGNQNEYERCAELPPCLKCVRVVPAAKDWEPTR